MNPSAIPLEPPSADLGEKSCRQRRWQWKGLEFPKGTWFLSICKKERKVRREKGGKGKREGRGRKQKKK